MTDDVPTIDPDRTALLVMDHQPAIVGKVFPRQAHVVPAADLPVLLEAG